VRFDQQRRVQTSFQLRLIYSHVRARKRESERVRESKREREEKEKMSFRETKKVVAGREEDVVETK